MYLKFVLLIIVPTSSPSLNYAEGKRLDVSLHIFTLPSYLFSTRGKEEMHCRGTQIVPCSFMFVEQKLLLQLPLLAVTRGQSQPEEDVVRCQAPESISSSASTAAACSTTKADTRC